MKKLISKVDSVSEVCKSGITMSVKTLVELRFIADKFKQAFPPSHLSYSSKLDGIRFGVGCGRNFRPQIM